MSSSYMTDGERGGEWKERVPKLTDRWKIQGGRLCHTVYTVICVYVMVQEWKERVRVFLHSSLNPIKQFLLTSKRLTRDLALAH